MQCLKTLSLSVFVVMVVLCQHAFAEGSLLRNLSEKQPVAPVTQYSNLSPIRCRSSWGSLCRIVYEERRIGRQSVVTCVRQLMFTKSRLTRLGAYCLTLW